MISDTKIVQFLEEHAPVAIWCGHDADGTPMWNVDTMDGDGERRLWTFGSGASLRDAVENAIDADSEIP